MIMSTNLLQSNNCNYTFPLIIRFDYDYNYSDNMSNTILSVRVRPASAAVTFRMHSNATPNISLLHSSRKLEHYVGNPVLDSIVVSDST